LHSIQINLKTFQEKRDKKVSGVNVGNYLDALWVEVLIYSIISKIVLKPQKAWVFNNWCNLISRECF